MTGNRQAPTRRSMLASSLGAIAATGLGGVARAADAAVTIDATAPATPYPHYWEACVGSDRAIVAMRADWRRDLALVHQQAGFRSVRFHGLLDDDIGLCRRIGPDGPELNFLYIDQIFDAMLAIGVRPLVELSFMPLPLASSDNTIFWYKGNTSPPKAMRDWSLLIAGLARHLVERYGIAEVAGWRFEVWNEPNLNFWAADQAAYFALYAATARAIKQIDRRLQVGGPATAQLMWIPDFIAYCATHNAPVDFISSHVYADDPQQNLFGRDMHYAREQVIPRALALANAHIRRSALPKLPLAITEWTSQNPAFIAETIAACQGLCDTFSYWTFDNIFEEHGPLASYDNDAYGLLNQGGVARPSLHAFRLLHQLGTERLPASPAPIVATRRADGTVAALAWNLITNDDVSGQTGNPMAAIGAEPILDGPARSLTLAVKGAAIRRATATVIDIAGDPARRLYQGMGRPASPTAAQLRALRAAAAPPAPVALAVSGNAMRLAIPANGVVLIELA